MARLVMVAPIDDPTPAPRCRRSRCQEPGTNSTVLVRGRYEWDLRHCDEHANDGPSMARQLGYLDESPMPQAANVCTMLTPLPEPDSDTAFSMKTA